ncbi:MAG: RNA polymerase sigma factor [Chloroflexi bacterium]|nr:MAG: RNA polymerase sigma factor [Chloroflexota bacterium]
MGVGYALSLPADEPLRLRAVAGNEAAFDSLLRPLVEPALRLAFSMLGDRRDAEDATQEALTRAWRKLHQLRAGMPVRPWFFAIVANQCRNVRRTPWFRLTSLAEVVGRPLSREPEVEHLDLERAIQQLPLADRGALFLYFYLDLSIEEVAHTLGVSPAAAKSRIYRACHRLRPAVALEELG